MFTFLFALGLHDPRHAVVDTKEENRKHPRTSNFSNKGRQKTDVDCFSGKNEAKDVFLPLNITLFAVN